MHAWSWSFNATDGPAESQTVFIDADDGNGGMDQTSFELIVNNVPPSVNAVSVPPAPVAITEQPIDTVMGAFRDPAGDGKARYPCSNLGANPFRGQAYRRAAETLVGLQRLDGLSITARQVVTLYRRNDHVQHCPFSRCTSALGSL